MMSLWVDNFSRFCDAVMLLVVRTGEEEKAHRLAGYFVFTIAKWPKRSMGGRWRDSATSCLLPSSRMVPVAFQHFFSWIAGVNIKS